MDEVVREAERERYESDPELELGVGPADELFDRLGHLRLHFVLDPCPRDDAELDQGVTHPHARKAGHVREGLLEIDATDGSAVEEPLPERLVRLAVDRLNDGAVAKGDDRALPVVASEKQDPALRSDLEHLDDVGKRNVFE